MFGETEFPELRIEENLQAESSLGLTGVTRVILKTVGEHQGHICDELAWGQVGRETAVTLIAAAGAMETVIVHVCTC